MSTRTSLALGVGAAIIAVLIIEVWVYRRRPKCSSALAAIAGLLLDISIYEPSVLWAIALAVQSLVVALVIWTWKAPAALPAPPDFDILCGLCNRGVRLPKRFEKVKGRCPLCGEARPEFEKQPERL